MALFDSQPMARRDWSATARSSRGDGSRWKRGCGVWRGRQGSSVLGM